MKSLSLHQFLFRCCLETAPELIPAKPLFLRQQVATRDRQHTQLHQLKRELLRAALEQTPQASLFKPLCGAANQAVALAWDTAQPLLVFPCLFEELAQQVREEFLRQAEPTESLEHLVSCFLRPCRGGFLVPEQI